MNDAKVLSTLSEGEAAKSDRALVGEAQKNLTTDIDRSLTHVQKLRGMKNELSMAGGSMGGSMGEHDTTGSKSGMESHAGKSPAAGASGSQTESKGEAKSGIHSTGTGAMASNDKMSKLDEIERQLKDAKSAAAKLGNAKSQDLASAVDGVSTHLMGADTAFRDIAKWTNYTRLAQTSLGTMPVSGSGTGTGTMDEDHNLPSGTTPSGTPGTGTGSPSTTTPGSTTPGSTTPNSSMTPGTTPPHSTTPGTTPPKNEPTQPAPGGPPK
jgi:hypothetical protein